MFFWDTVYSMYCVEHAVHCYHWTSDGEGGNLWLLPV